MKANMKNQTTVEDQVQHANRSWEYAKKRMIEGVIDIHHITSSMALLNNAHRRALTENKRHLITDYRCKSALHESISS